MPTVEQRLEIVEAALKDMRLDIVSLRNAFISWHAKVSSWQDGIEVRQGANAQKAENRKRKEHKRDET